MNKEEILKYLNYKGKYTKDVKRRLNKLLKKYHPDNNKDDKTTILVLYEIKKELENGTLKNNDKLNVSEYKNQSSTESNIYSFFIESMIERLKKQRERINKKINAIYNKINIHNEKIDSKQDELNVIELEINDLENELNELTKIDIIDKCLFFTIIIFILLSIVFKNVLFLLIMLIFIIFDGYYIYLRKKIYNKKKNRLIKSVKMFSNVQGQFNILEEKIEKFEKEEFKLKVERSRINNDIQYYNNELSKLNEKEFNKDYLKNNSNDKAYVKR